MEFESFFQVRLANYGDISAICKIIREAFTEYAALTGTDNLDALVETPEDVRRDIDNKIVLVALTDGEPVGTVRVEVRSDNTAYLTRFAVKTNCQNSGIGKSMMNLVDKIMQKKGVSRISLHTGSKITSLIRFYYGRGFYIESTESSRGYLRATLVKEYSSNCGDRPHFDRIFNGCIQS